MTLQMLKAKIHRATVVQAELNYVGSITVDPQLLEAAGILEYEKVQIVKLQKWKPFRDIYDRGECRQRNDLFERGSSEYGADAGIRLFIMGIVI